MGDSRPGQQERWPTTTMQPHFNTATPPGILVVDDDQLVLALLHALLSKNGFAVYSANSGLEALALYERQRQHIALVLLDVRMPGMDGVELFLELRQIDPDVVACFMSGHTGDYAVSDLLALGARTCFDKPFRNEDLVRRLWDLVLSSSTVPR